MHFPAFSKVYSGPDGFLSVAHVGSSPAGLEPATRRLTAPAYLFFFFFCPDDAEEDAEALDFFAAGFRRFSVASAWARACLAATAACSALRRSRPGASCVGP